jgi:hypothetical protein
MSEPLNKVIPDYKVTLNSLKRIHIREVIRTPYAAIRSKNLLCLRDETWQCKIAKIMPNIFY